MSSTGGSTADAAAASSLLDLASVKILLVPITPLTTQAFAQYADILSAVNVVSVSQATINLPLKASKFSHSLAVSHSPSDDMAMGENITSSHVVYLQFTTSNTEFPGTWNDLFLSNQIMGVVGIMNCREIGDLTKGVEQFQAAKRKYPNALISRCFAFDPLETTQDNVPGLILIPSVGDISFYINTMVQDMVNELFVEFGELLGRLERKAVITGPDYQDRNSTNQIVQPISLQPGPIITSGSASNLSYSGSAVNFSPMPTMPTAAVTEGRLGALQGSSQSSFTIPPSPALTTDLPSPPAVITQGSAVTGFTLSLIPMEKNKKRTPSRLLKYTGDLYLLAGKLDLAVAAYTSAAESCKNLYDFPWHAAALEGLYASKMLSLKKSGSSIFPTEVDIMLECRMNSDLDSFMATIVDKYRDILAIYERGVSPFTVGYQPLLQTMAVLRVMNVLSAMCIIDYQTPLIDGAGIPIPMDSNKGITEIVAGLAKESLGGGKRERDADKVPFDGVSKADIASWAVRLNTFLPYLSEGHAAWACVQVSGIFRRMRYWRKALFYASQSVSWISEGDVNPHESYYILCTLIAQCQGLRAFDDDGKKGKARQDFIRSKLASWSSLDDLAVYSSSSHSWTKLQMTMLERVLHAAASLKFESITPLGQHPIIVCGSLLLSKYGRFYNATLQWDMYSVIESAAKRVALANPEHVYSGLSLKTLSINSPHSMSQVTLENPTVSNYQKPGFLIFNATSSGNKKVDQSSKERTVVSKDPFAMRAVLCNPLEIDVEVSVSVWVTAESSASSTIVGSDSLSCELVSISLPANRSDFPLQLSCVASKSGTFYIQGLKLTRWGGRVYEYFSLLQPLVLTVIDQIPRLEFISATNASLNLLEGEMAFTYAELKNVGSYPVDYVALVFTEKHSPAADSEEHGRVFLYEREVYNASLSAFWLESYEVVSPLVNLTKATNSVDSASYMKVKALDGSGMQKWTKLRQNNAVVTLCGEDADAISLQPGQCLKLKFGIFGKSFCHGATLSIRYGLREQQDTFYCRDLVKPYFLTVHAPLIISNLDVLPCAQRILTGKAFEVKERANSPEDKEDSNEPAPFDNETSVDTSEQPHLSIEEITMIADSGTLTGGDSPGQEFFFTFDIKNVWINPLMVDFVVRREESKEPATFSNLIHAGVTKRIVLPLTKLYLDEEALQKPIPTPKDKQFVVSNSGLSAYQELLKKACFWYREKILGGLDTDGILSASWSNSKRIGNISLRSFYLFGQALPLVRQDPVSISLSASSLPDGGVITVQGNQILHVKLETFAQITFTISNHENASSPVPLCFRILPLLGKEVISESQMESYSGLVFGGSLESILPPLAPGRSWSTDLVIRGRSRGKFMFKFHAEVIRHVSGGDAGMIANKASTTAAPDLSLDRLFSSEFTLFIH